MIKRLINKCKKMMFLLIPAKLYSFLTPQNNTFVFFRDYSKKMSSNAYFFAMFLKKQNKKILEIYIPRGETSSMQTYWETAKAIMSAKYLVLDDYVPLMQYIPKSQKRFIIQLWHAPGVFKKFGNCKEKLPTHVRNIHRKYDKVYVSGSNVKEQYANAFGVPIENVIATGIPRTDFFYDKNMQASIHKINDAQHRKIILYAPTYRGKGMTDADYKIDLELVKRMQIEFSDEYILLYKPHKFIFDDINLDEYRPFLKVIDKEQPIEQFLLQADILITDYSSVCIDFALLRKPILFHAPDLDEYTNSRDFFMDYAWYTDGNHTKTIEELIVAIKTRKWTNSEKIKEFFYDYYDENASRRILQDLDNERKER